MTIINDMKAAVNSGKTIEQAIEEIVPGADPIIWERILSNKVQPKPRQRKSISSPRFEKFNLPDNIIGRLREGNNQKPVSWDTIQEMVQEQRINVAPGQTQELWRQGNTTISLFRRKRDDRLCLWLSGQLATSKPIALWGKNVNSPSNQGLWKLAHNAQSNFEQWQKDSGVIA